jgi:hypothetical protein
MPANPFETRFASVTQIVRKRLLPVSGNVVVALGQRVTSEDCVAEATLTGTLHILDLARALERSPSALARHLKVREGQVVSQGAPLVSIGRFLRRPQELLSPRAGTVERIHEGRLFLRGAPRALRLPARLTGDVVEIWPERGVAIRAIGALMQGVWGCSGLGQGPLACLTEKPDDLIPLDRADEDLRGRILVAGMLRDAQTLAWVGRIGLAGLVAGSIPAEWGERCRKLGFPLVITEGMGQIPMAGPLFDYLRSQSGRAALISDGSGGDGGPELIVPLLDGTEPSSVMVMRPMGPGRKVRLVRPPFVGLVGTIVTTRTMPQGQGLGALIQGADVRLANGRRLFVPYVNLELID